jgi:hypothetical protein
MCPYDYRGEMHSWKLEEGVSGGSLALGLTFFFDIMRNEKAILSSKIKEPFHSLISFKGEGYF